MWFGHLNLPQEVALILQPRMGAGTDIERLSGDKFSQHREMGIRKSGISDPGLDRGECRNGDGGHPVPAPHSLSSVKLVAHSRATAQVTSLAFLGFSHR